MQDRDQQQRDQQENSYQGYATPGEDRVAQSSSSAVPSLDTTSEERLTTPKPVIESIGETPGDANPALVETIGSAQGQTSTADLLMARESAEEQGLRGAGAAAYQEQSQGGNLPKEFAQTDSGRPNWPDDRQQAPTEYMESPRANMSFVPSSIDKMGGGSSFDARVDRTMDRAGTQASAQESRSGLAPVGMTADEDKYEEREFGRPSPPSDIEMAVPDMVNLPPENEDD
ncbi:MAG TPA: hypothetical protein VM409_06560 [Chloroflexia bacterium]|nr:hypothetical protein [Chloroflexia bacterium]